MNPAYDTMVWLTYTAQHQDGYEDWLQRVDNPFFNSRPCIAHYSNWKIVAAHGASLPFTHFDFLGLGGPGSVEPVWFDGPLDEFREGWVTKWGYAGGTPPTVNRYGYLATRRAATAWRVGRTAIIVGTTGADEPQGFTRWWFTERLRKHWAIGRAPQGEPWRTALVPAHRPGGATGLLVRFVASPEGWDRDLPQGAFALLATCIAAPD
ncbi:MAG: hypothetical protein FJX65_16290 [Alphaproteobacteria bacterium]|nr:hypothetical protein [Alphaproteobacteria bacterium]